jgi:hypothetical protein
MRQVNVYHEKRKLNAISPVFAGAENRDCGKYLAVPNRANRSGSFHFFLAALFRPTARVWFRAVTPELPWYGTSAQSAKPPVVRG